MELLDTLFKWQGELEIKDSKDKTVIVNDKPLVVYQRIVGDAELAQARKQALKASGILRKELRDNTSDSHIASIPDYNEIDDETLGRMMILAEALDIRTKAIELVEKPKEPKEPKFDASLEEQEQYETAVTEYGKALEEATQKKSIELADTRLEELKDLERGKLVDTFIITIIDSLCRTKMLKVFNSWCAFLGTYKNKRMKALAFSNYNAFDNAAPELKHQIIDGYISLELGGEDLKN